MAEQSSGKNIRALVTFKEDAALLQQKDTQEGVVTPQEKIAVYEAQETDPSKDMLSSLAEEVASSSTVRESVLSDKQSTYSDTAATGTIIRETKRKRFRLLPAMMQASKEWVEEKKEVYDKIQHPYHPIANADARKEVIEAAISKSAVAPREDFKAVAGKLKDLERKSVQTGITVKAKQELPEPQWASLTEEPEEERATAEPSAPLTESPRTPEVPETVSTESFAPVLESKEPEETIQETITEDKIEPIEALPDPLLQVSKSEASVPQEIRAAEAVPDAPSIAQQIPSSPREVSRMRGVHFPMISLNMQYVVAVFLFLAIVGGVATSFLIFKREEMPLQKVVVEKIPNFINAPQTSFALQENREELLQSVAEHLRANQSIVQLYPAYATEENAQKPATAEQVFLVLNLHTPASFTRNVPELTFGGVAQEPFILMKVQNFDTAFAGMLAWENAMSADLSPLFGDTVLATFDPSARTDTQVHDAFFKDAIASNKNVRILLDEEGHDRIVYTFVDQNTLLITTTRAALEALLPLF